MITVNTKKFDRAMKDLIAHSRKTDKEVVTSAGRILLRKTVFNTPVKHTKGEGGALRAGWRVGWIGLDMNGNPGTRRSLGEKGRYTAQGEFIDKRNNFFNPSITVRNTTFVVEDNGKREAYGTRLNNGEIGKHKGFMQEGLNEASDQVEKKANREYFKLIKRANRG